MSRMPIMRRAGGLLLGLMFGLSLAADENAATDAAPPSRELLEFLGGFGTEDGAWLDPLSLRDEDPALEATSSTETDNDEQSDNDAEHRPLPGHDGQGRNDTDADPDGGNSPRGSRRVGRAGA